MRLIDIKTLSRMFKIKQKTIYDWVHKAQIPHYKMGRLVRFDYDEIKKWLSEKYRKPKYISL